MRCFHVLIHGQLTWISEPPASPDLGRPDGFYCHRFILAADAMKAADKAFHRVRTNLDRRTGWLSEGVVELALEADEVSIAPLYKLLKRENRGHTFYEEN